MQLSQDEIDALMGANAAPDDGAADTQVALLDSVYGDDIHRILALSVPISVKLAEREMPIRAITALSVGSIIEFDVPADRELELVVSTTAVGTGQAVKVGENFGLRVSRLKSIRDRIRAMGG